MSIQPELRDLLTAIRDVFDLPPAAHTDEDQAARKQVLDQRAYNAHAAIDALLILEHPRIEVATEWLRRVLATHPADYTRQQPGTGRVPSLCPPCKRGDCDECMAIDHPGLPDLYSCHYVEQPHKACGRRLTGGEPQ